MKEIVNRVAQSSLVTIDLEKYFPKKEIVIYDLKDDLYKGMILKEKDFRQSLKNRNWSEFEDKVICIQCTADAIIPMWAYMLLSCYLSEVADSIYSGSVEGYISHYIRGKIDEEKWGVKYRDGKIILRGCSNKHLPSDVYTYATQKLAPVVQSLMFGEACSAVPIYKKKRIISRS